MNCYISNGVEFIGVDSKHRTIVTESLSEAVIFSSETKANNFYRTLPQRFHSGDFRVMRGGLTTLRPLSTCGVDIVFRRHVPGTEFVAECVDQVGNCIATTADRRTALEERLAESNRQIQDILHAAEFFELNAAQGYKLYRLLRDARIRRRKAKDGLAALDMVLNAKVGECADGSLENKLLRLNDRVYNPRMIPELFGLTGT